MLGTQLKMQFAFASVWHGKLKQYTPLKLPLNNDVVLQATRQACPPRLATKSVHLRKSRQHSFHDPRMRRSVKSAVLPVNVMCWYYVYLPSFYHRQISNTSIECKAYIRCLPLQYYSEKTHVVSAVVVRLRTLLSSSVVDQEHGAA